MSLFDLELDTEHLILRPPRREDFDAYAELVADEQAARCRFAHRGTDTQ